MNAGTLLPTLDEILTLSCCGYCFGISNLLSVVTFLDLLHCKAYPCYQVMVVNAKMNVHLIH